MVNDVLYHIRLTKHYWRSMPFFEMAELYLSRFLRTVSQGMIGLFAVVFLYQRGYSSVSIFMLVGGYFLLRVLLSFAGAYYVAWAGPKRAIFMSNVLIAPSLFALVAVDRYAFTAVAIYFVFQALSLSLYYLASDVQFSSIKHDRHVGKEIGWFNIAERIGMGIAPLVGGFVAYLFGPEATMWMAAGLSVVSALPLFMSPDRIRRRQKIIFQGFPFKLLRGQLLSNMCVGTDYVTSSVTWALFIAVAIFGLADNSVYAKLGVVFSLSLVSSIVSSHLYGVLIDHRRARDLFRTGIVINALIHGTRAFVGVPVGVAMTNIANEVGTSAYQMPYVQNEYDVADNLPGYRIVYTSLMIASYALGAAFMAFLAAALVWYFGDTDGMKYSFFVAILTTLLMLRSGFPALRRQA